MNALLTIGVLTLHEAVRKRILLAAAILGTAFLTLYAVGYHFIARETHQAGPAGVLAKQITLSAFTLAGLYAVNFLGMMAAVLLPLDTLSGEIASGVMQTVASRPVRRSEIVLGKWCAYAAVVMVYVLVLAGGVLLVARATAHFTPPGITTGLPLMVFECVLLVTLSIWGGVRFSTVTSGVVAFGLYGVAFIGGWVEQIGSFTGSIPAQNVGTLASLVMPTDSMWQLAAYHMQPAFMTQMHMTPFSPASVPSVAMIAWAALWGAAVLVSALATFRRRPL